MAGEVWVLDIMWHGLLLARDAVFSFWSSWSMEFLVATSLFLHIALTILAEFRWRRAGPVLNFFVWLFYVGADYVGTTALGSLSVSSASGEHQLVAFWGAFFLLHLGGPDNISAYSVEDNDLSWRDVFEAILRVFGAAYVVCKSISGSWTLVTAAWLMLVLGAFKYVEKTVALYRASLENIRSSMEKKKEQEMELAHDDGLDNSCRHCYHPRELEHRWARWDWEYNEEEPLLFAHSLFQNICMHAMVDASDVKENPDDAAESTSSLLDRGWEDMCKVVEIQLSLMYDILYTKAAVIHTGLGYCIRACSPILTAAALVLFELSNEGGRRRADVVITHVLLGATLFLETASLLRALGSSWAASALLRRKGGWSWLRHAVLCKRRWHWLHRVVASLRRIFRVKGGYRRWSGSIGEFNLLRFCSARDNLDDLCSTLAEMVGVGHEDWWNKFRHSRTLEIPYCVKRLLFKRIKKIMEEVKGTKKSLPRSKEHKDAEGVKDQMTKLTMFRTQRGQGALLELKCRGLATDLSWSLGDELQEGIITWHIATHVYLFKSNKAMVGSAMPRVKAIRTLSEYMMYLLAFRPDMLPGLALRSLYKLTCQDLFRLSSDFRRRRCSRRPPRSFWNIILGLSKKLIQLHGNSYSCRLSQGEEMLASILCGDYSMVDESEVDELNEVSSGYERIEKYLMTTDSIKSYISLGSELANQLLRMDETETPGLDLLQVIFNVWVEMLFNASYQCSRDSHAKHLNSGGELTSVVWLMVEHAGLFSIDKDSKGYKYRTEPQKPVTSENGCDGPHITSTHVDGGSEGTGIGQHSEVNIRICGLF